MMQQQQQPEDFTGLYSYLTSDQQQQNGNLGGGLYGSTSQNYHQIFPPPSSFFNTNNYEIGAGSYSPLYNGTGRYQQQQHGMMMMENIGEDIIGGGSHHSNNNGNKAMMALRNHKEAEKRRRERINSHLDRLRALLPCNSKTDKATLLAKVVQRVGELTQQTSNLLNLDSSFPTSTDSYSVYTLNDQHDDDDDHCNYQHTSTNNNDSMMTMKGKSNNKFILKASLCCEDRADLFADLIETLDSLNLKTLRAEISTLGGRVRNVFIVSRSMLSSNTTGDDEDEEDEDEDEDDESSREECIGFLLEALKGIVERSSSNNNGNERVKRRRRLVAAADPMTMSSC